MLKEMSPSITRVALLFGPGNPSWIAYVRVLEAAASLGVRLTPAGVHDAAEIATADEVSE
jgi:hypothetical protein